ncbi:MAG TPA: response regulator [Candidatus Xenobia bacterium]|jgi:hypothetical protein
MPEDIRILVVEDEAVVAMDLESRLGRLGYQVVGTAGSGEEALDEAARCTPSLILMDVRLGPGIDGIDAALRLNRTMDVPIIFVTAFSDRPTLERAKRAGPYGYILKPFEDRELQTGIEMATSKHQTDRKLKQAERWLASTLASIGDGVVAADPDGRITFLNEVAQQITGWTLGEALGKPFGTVMRLVRGTLDGPIDLLGPVLRDGLTVHLAHETVLIRQDGSRCPIDDSAAPVRDEEGRVTGLVAVFRDGSSKVRLEDQLRQAAKMEGIGRLASGLAHDLNNLLTVIMGCNDLLLSSLEPGDERRDDAEEIRRTTQRAAHLTRQLLAFSRPHATLPVPLQPNAVVESLKSMLDRLLPGHVRLVLDLGRGIPQIRMDEVHCEQVLLNLTLNARDAFGDGPGTVRISTRKADSEVLLQVSDDGPGMDGQTLMRIFDPFFTTKANSGTGLGLSVVQSIIADNDGRIEVDSQVGVGTTFTVRLPAFVQPPDPGTGAGGMISVLLVEENDLVRHMTSRVLKSRSFQVTAVATPLEALDRLRDGLLPQVLLTNFLLNDPSGMDLPMTVRAAYPSVKVVCMSSQADEIDLGDRMTPCMGVLRKPFNPADLFSVLERVAL